MACITIALQHGSYYQEVKQAQARCFVLALTMKHAYSHSMCCYMFTLQACALSKTFFLMLQNRGLADRISDDPPTIRLRFMHKTGDQERGVDDYYLHSKENKCVSCGEAGHYLRYRVVPACYRRNFPVQWKSHRSHDIVLLCVDCHHVAHRAAETVKRQLSQQYGVPLFPPKVKPEAVGGKVSEAHPYNVRRAAVALKHHGESLPEHRRRELQQMVRGFVRQSDEPADDEEEWLSQAELEQGLLAGLGPRQKRRMLRQLAAEKAGKADDNSQNPVDSDSAQPNSQEEDSTSAELNRTASAQELSSLPGSDTAQHGSRLQGSDAGQRDNQAAAMSDEDEVADNSTDESDQHQQHANVKQGSGEGDAGTSIQQLSRKRQGVSSQGVADEDTNGHAWHGRQVVAAALAEGGSDSLLVLIQRFRQSFTDALHPKFLPSAWHIMHRYSVCSLVCLCACLTITHLMH